MYDEKFRIIIKYVATLLLLLFEANCPLVNPREARCEGTNLDVRGVLLHA